MKNKLNKIFYEKLNAIFKIHVRLIDSLYKEHEEKLKKIKDKNKTVNWRVELTTCKIYNYDVWCCSYRKTAWQTVFITTKIYNFCNTK